MLVAGENGCTEQNCNEQNTEATAQAFYVFFQFHFHVKRAFVGVAPHNVTHE